MTDPDVAAAGERPKVLDLLREARVAFLNTRLRPWQPLVKQAGPR